METDLMEFFPRIRLNQSEWHAVKSKLVEYGIGDLQSDNFECFIRIALHETRTNNPPVVSSRRDDDQPDAQDSHRNDQSDTVT